MASLTPTYQQLSLSVKYTSVLFPLDTLQFLRAVSKQGFIIPDSIEQVPFGTRVEISGLIARKGDISVRVDSNRQVLGVQAPNVNSVLDEMDSIESLLKTELDLDSHALADYYELLASLTIKAGRHPLECWETHFAEAPILNKFSDVLGTDVSLFGVRLAVRGEVPNQPDWLEIRIEPSVQSPQKHHSVQIICRHSRRDEVFAFGRKLEDTLRNLISLVEQKDS
ncbi:MAG: hypothetical protein Q7O66_20430 [Dehalococcoidia bacterium]|nr:hypothetical protein [Dehalococcoidia bacterium]